MITRDKTYSVEPDVRVFTSLEGALLALGRDSTGKPLDHEVFVIGGSEIYAHALPFADRVYLTRIHRAFEGDKKFPDLPSEFKLAHTEKVDGAIPFSVERWER